MSEPTAHQNVFIFVLQLYALRKLMQGSETTPKAPLGNNARPLQHLHHRTVRTNIDFKKGEVRNSTCRLHKFVDEKWKEQSPPSDMILRQSHSNPILQLNIILPSPSRSSK
jgi:hypothetical protein